jgi:hypothetical protein
VTVIATAQAFLHACVVLPDGCEGSQKVAFVDRSGEGAVRERPLPLKGPPR